MTELFPSFSHNSESSSVQDADNCPVTESHRGILKLAASSQHQGKEINTLLQVSREECKEAPASCTTVAADPSATVGEGDR